MKDVSWIHTADLHLGKPMEHWRGTKEEYIKRKEEYRATFQRMIDLIESRSIPFLFISGDFLEHGYVSRSLWEFILDQFARIPGTEVWIAPGNHDPYRADSIYMKEKWPDHVHIFQSRWESHTYTDYDLQIVGKGFADFHEKERSLPKIGNEGRKIMVVHGDLATNRKKSDYFPIWEEELSALELDYVALGHIHQAFTRILDNERKTLVRYPGSPEALSWKETKERTITIGKIDDQGRNVEVFPIQTKTYEQHVIQLTNLFTKEQVLDTLLTELASEDKNSYHLLRLKGRIQPGWRFAEEIPWIVMQLQVHGFKHIYIEDHLLPDFDLERLKRKSNVMACFISMMEEKMAAADDEEKEKIHAALYKGLEAILIRGTS